MIPVYLIGGGWRAETFSNTYRRFLSKAAPNETGRLAIVVAEESETDSHDQFLRFLKPFETIGFNPAEASEIIVSAENPLTGETLAEINPTGVFVCGGLTPAYYQALCLDKSWLEFLSENEIPYCGFSAGAAIAGRDAIIGGWQRKINGRIVTVADENAGEDLDFLEVREGLGLVPFAVEVHATQWGTLSRLIHAVDAGLVEKGWAIDENTMLEVTGGQITVHGAGNVYMVQKREGKIELEIFNQE